MVGEKIKNQTKVCIGCNREFNNRKRWNSRGLWEEIKYCSDKCRKNKNTK